MLGALFAIASGGAVAQVLPGRRPFRIGFPVEFYDEALRRTWVGLMREFGWVEKQDFVIVESGMPYDPARAEVSVARVLRSDPDVIWVVSTAYALAAHRLTNTVPIVMRSSGYPVEAGLAVSLARPGKNVTGNSSYAGAGIWGKQLELLREVKPGVKRVGLFWTYVPPAFAFEEIEAAFRDLLADAKTLGLAIQRVDVPRPEDLPAAIKVLEASRPDALLLTSGAMTWRGWSEVMQFTVDRKLPSIMESEPLPGDKNRRPLMTLAAGYLDLNRRAIGYIDRILRGANPGDLPIQLPAKLELTVSQQTAKEIGLTLPRSILLRADRVIE